MRAQAFLDYMRSTKQIAECGTSKTREPDARLPERPAPVEGEAPAEGEAPKPKTHDVVSAPAFGNSRLTNEQEDLVYIELAEFLNEKAFAVLANKCIDYVVEKDSLRVRFANAKSLMMMCKTNEAEKHLHHLFTNVDPELTDAIVMYGHCKFIQNNLDEAIDSFYKAIRILNLKGEKF